MPRPELRCSVVTRFLPEQSSTQEELYAFAYTVTIQNLSLIHI